MELETYRNTKGNHLSYSQYIEGPPRGSKKGFSFSPMATLYVLNALLLVASTALMTQGDEWRVLAVLTLSSSVGGAFGLFLSAMTKSGDIPWQIRAWRFVANMLGGIGFGSLAMLAVIKWWDVSAGPLLTFGVGFVCSWLSVGIARIAEPALIRRLEELGHLAKPLPPGTPVINLTRSPTTKIQ